MLRNICLSGFVLLFTAFLPVTNANAKSPVPKKSSAKKRPNIIVVMSDDQGFNNLGMRGHDVLKTPHLDRFAKSSLEMTRFYVNPVCSPTRAAFLTGRYYLRTGIFWTGNGGAKMCDDELTIAEQLRDAGYETGIFGKWHLGDNYPLRPQDQGFKETYVHRSGGITQTPDVEGTYFQPVLFKNGKRIQPKGYCTDLFFDAALTFIEKNKDRPFFVYIPTNVPHKPLHAKKEDSDRYQKLKDKGAASFFGMLHNLDENFGRLTAKIDKLGLRENSIVIFITDNGAVRSVPKLLPANKKLRAAKGSIFEGGIRVPFFVRWPAVLQGNKKIDRIAAHIDLLPTLLTAAGVPVKKQKTLDGKNLLPLWTGKTKSADWPDRYLFSQHTRGIRPNLYQNATIFNQQYKLTAYEGSYKSKKFKVDLKNLDLQLYDIEKDPQETKNLAATHPQIVAKLRKEYETLFASMKKSRDFKPGIIQIGTPHENPTYLCQYQDAEYVVGGGPIGWPVKIVGGGRYQLLCKRPDIAGTIAVTWQGKTTNVPVKQGQSTIEITLAKGEGMLKVRFVRSKKTKGQPKNKTGSPKLYGDVVLTYLPKKAEKTKEKTGQ